ncbi:MAG: aldehyde dehydrogenase, partial [Acidobacteriota bacterium]
MKPTGAIDDGEVQAILERVRARVAPPQPAAPPAAKPASPVKGDVASSSGEGAGVFATVDAAVAAADRAQRRYADLGLDARRQVIDAVRAAMRAAAAELGRLAHQETGLGRPEDKRLKNLLVTERTPGPEELVPEVVTGDGGMTVTEYAPWGVIGSITPTTNPTATIINNTIAALAAGNAVVFNPHPAARRVSAENVRLLNRAIVAAGGPPNLVATIPEPTIETARELMHHRGVRLLLVTGGGAVVQEALRTDKRAITAGPGNPPVVVDETADLELAAREIVRGASFDNNVICTDEKEVIAVAAVADDLLRGMARAGAVIVSAEQLAKLEKVIFESVVERGEPCKPGTIDKAWIGKNAGAILGQIGV